MLSQPSKARAGDMYRYVQCPAYSCGTNAMVGNKVLDPPALTWGASFAMS